ncbi:cytidylyltransferase domain-containing protein [Magnetospirillum fulvum]|uniref:N-acylneuraminate cytidylyltransferase n=1 Tax=Magnetospirillum fulvum TaxID=1082 RepID=A0A1H6H735_MAGFU|nr:acylneuraminate cytidylyltransferase family protein [Magnetospirillum fulvum]SEH30094.1 N-acylneuraminate cytidylyltransferase [Magnetospirillum fulvum]
MVGSPRAVALIPARSGSVRVRHKNIRTLNGHPVIAYSIRAAIESGVFASVVVSTDSELYADIARHYGAEVPFLRPAEYCGATSPDIQFVRHALEALQDAGQHFDAFSILRPTSPFRLPETIRRAWGEFLAAEGADSLRAVEKCEQHPCKMWVVRGQRMHPLIPFGPAEQPWHSSQYPSLPEIYVQNASLEMAWSRVALANPPTIAGHVLVPFLTEGAEGLDINKPKDLWVAEQMIASGEARLPTITIPAFRVPDGPEARVIHGDIN